MKKILIVIIVTLSIFNVSAQEKSQKIIFDVTSTDNKVYQSVMLTIKIMTSSHPDTKFDIIAYGEAVPMFMKNQSVVADEIAKYVDNENVKFTACEVSMALFNIKKDQLITGVTTINNAVSEIVKKHGNGWAYIKSGN